MICREKAQSAVFGHHPNVFRPYDEDWQHRLQQLLDRKGKDGVLLLEKWMRDALSKENMNVERSKGPSRKNQEVLGLIDKLESLPGHTNNCGCSRWLS